MLGGSGTRQRRSQTRQLPCEQIMGRDNLGFLLLLFWFRFFFLFVCLVLLLLLLLISYTSNEERRRYATVCFRVEQRIPDRPHTLQPPLGAWCLRTRITNWKQSPGPHPRFTSGHFVHPLHCPDASPRPSRPHTQPRPNLSFWFQLKAQNSHLLVHNPSPLLRDGFSV